MRRLSDLPHIEIFTDGACSGNPGPGGWGAILRSSKGVERELNGREDRTTNNQMELMAVISALEALKGPSIVDLTTDSQYVIKGITNWIHGWKKNGWKNAEKQPVKNVDLWQRLELASKRHKVSWHWIKGHAGHAENERADELAREAIAGRIVSSKLDKVEQRNFVGRLVGSVRSSVETQNWYGALTVALILPDICGHLENPASTAGIRYSKWWDSYLRSTYTSSFGHVFLSGRDAYALRCAVLHEGSDSISRQRAREALENFQFVAPPDNGGVIHRNQHNSTLWLQIDLFCEEICEAVDRWLSVVKHDQEIDARINLSLLIKDSQEFFASISGAKNSQ